MAKTKRKNIRSAARSRMATWKPDFIEALKTYGTVLSAAKVAGIERRTAYLHRETDAEFKRDWLDALEDYKESLEEEVDKQGRDGNMLGLIFRLKRLDPAYRDHIDVNVNYEQQFRILIAKLNLTQEQIEADPILRAAAARWNVLPSGGGAGIEVGATTTG